MPIPLAELLGAILDSFGGANALLQQSKLDYERLKMNIRNISFASDSLVGIAENKINSITKALIETGR